MRTIVLAAALVLAPVGAWGQSVVYPNRDPSVSNATVWRQSLETDMANGRDPAGICRDANIYAGSSENVDFKNWAYGVANRYCNMPEPSAGGSGDGDSTPKATAPTPEQPQFVNGVMVRLCSHGMPCLGQLKRAMGIWE